MTLDESISSYCGLPRKLQYLKDWRVVYKQQTIIEKKILASIKREHQKRKYKGTLKQAEFDYMRGELSDKAYVFHTKLARSFSDSRQRLKSLKEDVVILRAAEKKTYSSKHTRGGILPNRGKAFRAWKSLTLHVIAEIEIPANALRIKHSYGKCRASSVIVIGFYDRRTGKPLPSVAKWGGWRCKSLLYRKGAMVKCTKKFDSRTDIECASGIHFFLTKEQAKDWGNQV